MKNKSILFFLSLVMMACTSNEVNFTYSPTQPRAGQMVTFTNTSDDAEEWLWSFGDGSTSTLKNPTKTYRKAGTYTIILKADNNDSYTHTAQITVLDTIPTFSCTTDSVEKNKTIDIFSAIEFKTYIYNPYNYDIAYQWQISDNTYTLLSDNMHSSALKLYFLQPADSITISLTVEMNGKETTVSNTYSIRKVATEALIMKDNEDIYQQRIFGSLYADAEPSVNDDDLTLLDLQQDTTQTYNSKTYTCQDISQMFDMPVEGFLIANLKVYFRSNGLYVATLNNRNNIVQIDNQPIYALYGDIVRQKLYWAVQDSVMSMPFVRSDNNKFTTQPIKINNLTNIQKITLSNSKR